MSEQNIYLKNLIEDVKKNKEGSLSKVIRLFEKYIYHLSKGKGSYIWWVIRRININNYSNKLGQRKFIWIYKSLFKKLFN